MEEGDTGKAKETQEAASNAEGLKESPAVEASAHARPGKKQKKR